MRQMKTIDMKGFNDETNRVMQLSKDPAYNEGIERAKSIVRRFIRPTFLEKQAKTMVFNSNGHLTLDCATRILLDRLPTEGLFDTLFGGDE